MTGQKRWHAVSEDEMRAVGREVVGILGGSGTLLLYGDLGSGKTVLTRGVAEGLGLAASEIQSPTFTLVHEHLVDAHLTQGRTLHHVDLYRLEPEDVHALDLEDLWTGDGIVVVEWAERLPFEIEGALHMTIDRLGDTERLVVMSWSPPRNGS